MSRPAFVYALADASGVRYVGKSVDPIARETAHRRGDRNSSSRHLAAAGARFLILEACDEQDVRGRELAWIRALCVRFPLVNVDGNVSPEARARQSRRYYESRAWRKPSVDSVPSVK